MALTPSFVQVGEVVVTVGSAGGPADAALLNDALAADEQLPSSAITV